MVAKGEDIGTSIWPRPALACGYVTSCGLPPHANTSMPYQLHHSIITGI